VSTELVQGNNVSIGVDTSSKIEADRIFRALSAGGKIETPLADQFWGGYYGFFQDKFGVWWSVNFNNPKV
jgi:PhnB protein